MPVSRHAASRAWPVGVPIKQSHSVIELAAPGQILMAASGQVSMTANIHDRDA
jgi:hypothetical protein